MSSRRRPCPQRPPPPPGYAELRVLREDVYLVPVCEHDPGATLINYWPLSKVAEDWFGPGRNLDWTHATRDAYRLSGASVVLSVEMVLPAPPEDAD